MIKINELAASLGQILTQKGLWVTTAESCTAGGVAEALTSVGGSSRWFERGFVTYSNDAKVEMLNVSRETLSTYGAVSEETVKEMALGAIKNSHSQLSIAVSGIAGPDGGTPEKPVGLVWFAWAKEGNILKSESRIFQGDRSTIRQEAVFHSLFVLESLLKG